MFYCCIWKKILHLCDFQKFKNMKENVQILARELYCISVEKGIAFWGNFLHTSGIFRQLAYLGKMFTGKWNRSPLGKNNESRNVWATSFQNCSRLAPLQHRQRPVSSQRFVHSIGSGTCKINIFVNNPSRNYDFLLPSICSIFGCFSEFSTISSC